MKLYSRALNSAVILYHAAAIVVAYAKQEADVNGTSTNETTIASNNTSFAGNGTNATNSTNATIVDIYDKNDPSTWTLTNYNPAPILWSTATLQPQGLQEMKNAQA